MTFEESIRTCLRKYTDFSGTASRSEYWYFMLFIFAGGVALSILSAIPFIGWLFLLAYVVFALGTLIPAVAAATRRLHDTGRSGWWQLICLVPFIGVIVLLVFLVQEGKATGMEHLAG